MEINLVQPNVSQNLNLASAMAVKAPKESTVLPKAETVQAVAKAPKGEPKIVDERLDDGKRQQLVQKAAALFRDVYAVSDTTFTIFKDSTGQYITRFTNLRDGTITYIPEQRALDFLAANLAAKGLISFEA